MWTLFTGKEEPEIRSGFPCTAFRSALIIDGWYLGWVRQYHIPGEGWLTNHTGAYGVGLSSKWSFGVYHIYYDGPHCGFRLGPLRFEWGTKDGWCEKCMPSE